MQLVALICLLALASPTPNEGFADKYLKELAQVWTVVVDQQNEKGAKLDDLLDALAGNPFFDIQEQIKLHPNYSGYVKNISARRPSTIDPDRIIAKTLILLGKNRAAIDAAAKSTGAPPTP